MAALILILLAQYPPEAQPIRPSVPILWMNVPVPAQDLARDTSGIIRVLLVISPLVTTDQASANSRCASWISSINSVIANDPPQTGRFQLAGCLIDTSYVGTGNTGADLNWISSRNAPNPPQKAHLDAWRDTLAADITVFDTTYADACGVSFICAGQFGAIWAYSVVNDGCAVGNFSFAHEVGHLACLNHDPPNVQGTPQFTYSYGYCPPTAVDASHRHDVLTYPGPCGGNRVPYYSNPNVSPFGYPFGTTTDADGARVWREQFSHLAAFRGDMPFPHHPSQPTQLTAVP